MYTVGKYERRYGEWVIDKEKLFIELQEYLDLLSIPPRCKKCRFVDVCSGGCRIVQQLTGDQENCPIPDLF